jgi:hypothetical protein
MMIIFCGSISLDFDQIHRVFAVGSVGITGIDIGIGIGNVITIFFH